MTAPIVSPDPATADMPSSNITACTDAPAGERVELLTITGPEADRLRKVASAIRDGRPGSSVRLTRLVNGVSTWTAIVPGLPPHEFDNREDATEWASDVASLIQARAVAAALAPDPSAAGVAVPSVVTVPELLDALNAKPGPSYVATIRDVQEVDWQIRQTRIVAPTPRATPAQGAGVDLAGVEDAVRAAALREMREITISRQAMRRARDDLKDSWVQHGIEADREAADAILVALQTTDADPVRLRIEAGLSVAAVAALSRHATLDAAIAALQRDSAISRRTAGPESGDGVTAASRDVLAERRRQVGAEGWSPEHDDGHDLGELGLAAALYALPYDADVGGGEKLIKQDDFIGLDMALSITCGWDLKPETDARKRLVKAGALILAEIERRDRADARISAEDRTSLADGATEVSS